LRRRRSSRSLRDPLIDSNSPNSRRRFFLRFCFFRFQMIGDRNSRTSGSSSPCVHLSGNNECPQHGLSHGFPHAGWLGGDNLSKLCIGTRLPWSPRPDHTRRLCCATRWRRGGSRGADCTGRRPLVRKVELLHDFLRVGEIRICFPGRGASSLDA
jgi:hypothetical protein